MFVHFRRPRTTRILLYNPPIIFNLHSHHFQSQETTVDQYKSSLSLSYPIFSTFTKDRNPIRNIYTPSHIIRFPSVQTSATTSKNRIARLLISQPVYKHESSSTTALHPSLPRVQSSQRVLHERPGKTNTRPSWLGSPLESAFQGRRHWAVELLASQLSAPVSVC